MSSPVLASDEQWSELCGRLSRTRLGTAPSSSWDLGVPAEWLSGLLGAWADFDRSGLQARVDVLDHRSVSVAGQALHVCVAEGQGARPLPLLLTNGWPSSFLEYLSLIPLLTATGSDAGTGPSELSEFDCFSLVIPALPGFGFSGAPAGDGLPGAALGGRAIARLWNRLMTEELGHARYVAHGSDLGAGVTAWLGRDHAASCAGIHLASPHLPAPVRPGDDAQKAFAAHVREWNSGEGAYAHLHSTKPLTLGAGLLDSPAGLAAWIGEKFMAWSSAGDIGAPFGSGALDQLLLATLTLYWTTGTIATSMLPYWAFSRGDNALVIDEPGPVPTAVDIFRGETLPLPQVPRSLGERYFTVSHWHEHPTGGHFPAASTPEVLAGALRGAFGIPATR